MKELIKPEKNISEKESIYEALGEGCTTVNIGCICDSKWGFADEDQEDVIF